MTMTTFKELSSAEIAVLDVIIDQRINSEGDIFKYDYRELQKCLKENNASRKHMITPDVQRKIVMDLSKFRIIDMDTIVNREFIDNYRSTQNPNYIPDESIPKFFWMNSTDWAYKHCQLDGRIGIEKVYNLDKGAVYIRMTKDEAAELNGTYIANHIVQLEIDMNRNRLRIKVDNKGGWLYSSSLHEDSNPFKIICYAFKNSNRRITREELFEKEGIDVRNKYLKSQVFSDNEAVKSLSQTQLLDLEKEWLILKKAARLTAKELNNLKSVFRHF